MLASAFCYIFCVLIPIFISPQLTATHRRFDRCAALLKSIADSGKSRGM